MAKRKPSNVIDFSKYRDVRQQVRMFRRKRNLNPVPQLSRLAVGLAVRWQEKTRPKMSDAETVKLAFALQKCIDTIDALPEKGRN